MNLWIIYTLGIFTISVHGSGYDDSTSRILDIAAHWKPVQTIHTAIGPHYLSIGTLNTANKLQLAHIANHNAHLLQQINGYNPPVTQYRNPFPVFQPSPSHHHHHFVVPKDVVPHYHTSASNIAQSAMPSNFLKTPYITGKPAFNSKPEFITKPDYYNGIHSTLGKAPQQPYFKQLPTMVKAATTSMHHDSSSYRDLILTPPPQPLLHGHSTLPAYKQQLPNHEKPVGTFSFPGDGMSSYSFFGPASHLIRNKPPKPQPSIFLPAEVGNNFKNAPPVIPSYRPYVSKHSQPIRFESSTPSFFGNSAKLSLLDSFQPNFSKSPFKELFPSTTSSVLTTQPDYFSSSNDHHVKTQMLPPIPASVLSPFFQQVRPNNQNFNGANVEQKSKVVKDDFSENLVPPPFVHLESSTFRSSTTTSTPTRKPISLLEQTKSLQILNKYNIPVISPLQDASNYNYNGNWMDQVVPQNYTVSSTVAFPTNPQGNTQIFATNPPNNPSVTVQPDNSDVLKTVNTLTHNSYNNDHMLLRPNNIEMVNANQERPPTSHSFLPTPYNDIRNGEHNFFTIEDAITRSPIRDLPASPISSNEIQNHVEIYDQPNVEINEIPKPSTTSLPKTVIQTSEYSTPSPSPPPPQPPSAPQNRLRGKNRRRRPRPTAPRTTQQTIEEDNRIPTKWQDTTNEVQEQRTTTTTARTIQRARPYRVRTHIRVKSTLPPADPTLRVIQRNSQKLNYLTSMQNRLPALLSSTTRTEFQRPVVRTTQPPTEETASLDEDYPSSTFTTRNENNAEPENEEENIINPSPPITSIIPEMQDQVEATKISTDAVTIHEQVSEEVSRTEQSISNQVPQQTIPDSSSSNEQIEQHISHRQRYRYKSRPTAAAPSAQIPTNEQTTDIEPSPSPSNPPATTSEGPKPVTRLRPANKYRPKDRPRFSVKDYRQRVKTHSTATATESSPTSSTTAGYRSRQRFPTRKRLLPSLRLKSSTTEKSTDAENNISEVEENPDAEKPIDPIPDTSSTTSTTTARSTTPRRGFNTRRNSINRFRVSTSSTESYSSVEDSKEKRSSTRQRTRERFTQTSRVPNTSKETIISTPRIQTRVEDLNNITIEAESPPITEGSKMESAIMKIIKTDHGNRQSSEITSAESNSSSDLNQSPSEQSERVAQLTISGSSYKFNNLNKNSLSRRIPGYFTLATEDPILPIEAFFPNVKNKSNRSR